MPDYDIRECTKDDLQRVRGLQIIWANEGNTHGFEPATIEYLQSKIGNYFLVLEVDKTIRGYIYGTIHLASNMNIFAEGEQYIEIEDIYIERSARNNGYGELMIKKINGIAGNNGITRSLVYSSSKNIETVIKFYKNCGYKSWNVQMYK